ncbi:MAG TPA: hypothetical protein VF627_00685 [Abditibacterium sp.]|jgi:hypothetical protein
MKFDPFLSDEPSIAPPTPGAALVRLCQTIGAVRARSGEEAPNANAMPSIGEKLASARANLTKAIEAGQPLGEPFQEAQNALRTLYAHIVEQFPDADERAVRLLSFGFPDPRLAESERVLPVDVATVVATHFKPERQIFTTLSFDESHGATAYWLLEARYFDEERLLDGVVENYAPQFSRVRLPVGRHFFIIESRNAHHTARSEEFELEVPAL